ncbi:MAG: N-acetylmuramoyl-L-alanine amidase [Lentisphaeria bacterium]|nr:N-acetylmuramoyl-L-alanine amidase [Lentisphaeria bacterium]
MRASGWILFTVLAATGIFTGCRPPEKLPPPLRFNKPLHALQLHPVSCSPEKLLLRRVERTFLFRPGSSVVQVSGIPVFLPEAISHNGNNFWSLGEYSCKNILLPLTGKKLPPVDRILIDPGHGGHDTGAVAADGTTEKELNLQLSQLLAAELKKRGYTVFLTRASDVFLSLDERPQLIEKYQAGLFISLHHNAAKNPEASGHEIYVYSSFPAAGDWQCADSIPFAFAAAGALKLLPELPVRGVKTARFKVLRQAPCPAILIEAGFVSNSAEIKLLKQPEFQRKFAEKLAGFLPVRPVTPAQ